jgi:thioredoxin-related protein
MGIQGFWQLVGLLMISSLVRAEVLPEVHITELKSLQQDAHLANKKRLPILIMFSAQHCPFCVTVKEAFLKPMLRSGHYTDKVLIRKVELDGRKALRGFNGEKLSVRALASRYKVFVTPTLILVDAKGRELAERLVGIATVDYYGGYLDDAIDSALLGLRKR